MHILLHRVKVDQEAEIHYQLKNVMWKVISCCFARVITRLLMIYLGDIQLNGLDR